MDPDVETIRSLLDVEEPDYTKASQLGPAVLPVLQTLVEGDDPEIAARAAYLAGRIGDAGAAPILETASTNLDIGVRAAAAGGARYLPGESADQTLLALIDDTNASVRKVVLRSVGENAGPELVSRVARRRTSETQPAVQELADQIFNNISKGLNPPAT